MTTAKANNKSNATFRRPPPAKPGHGRESVASLLRDTHRLYARALSKFIREPGITIMQWMILRALWAEDGITQRELSERVGLYDSATVTALDSMESADLVKRSPHPSDRRKFNIHLTKSGRALEGRLLPFAQRVNTAAEEGLSPAEIEKLRAMLRHLYRNLESYLAADGNRE